MRGENNPENNKAAIAFVGLTTHMEAASLAGFFEPHAAEKSECES